VSRELQHRRSIASAATSAYPCPKSPLKNLVVLTTMFLVGLAVRPAVAQTPLDPVIDVGIVQRFGSNPASKLTFQPPSGEQLTLKFETGGQEQTINTASDVKLEVGMQPLPQPQVTERLVLSAHRSFESAEDSANAWRAKGVEVEIAQPDGWQVWAKRSTYSTPLLRRLLFQNLQANGSQTAFLNTQTYQQRPKAALVVNGYRYQRDRIEISNAERRLSVTSSEDSARRLYGGNFTLQPNAYGTYTLVNHVPIETYLRGVVPHEIGSDAPQTTTEAQAILARTYALRNLRRFAIDNYQLCATTQCQVYRGLSGTVDASDRAIANTRGLVLTYENELVDALYSSTTGGITAPFNDVWNGVERPYLRAVVDSVQNIWDLSRYPLSDEQNLRTFISQTEGFNEGGWNQFRWRRSTTLPEIAAGLKQYFQNTQQPVADFTQVQQMQVMERSPAGRVQKIAIQTDRGAIELDKDEILRALYPPTSTLFYIDPIYETPAPQRSRRLSTEEPAQKVIPPSPGSAGASINPQSQSPKTSASAAPKVLKGYTFVGGGLGHGVGMSQTGAYKLGELGWSNAQILNFYYPGTQLQPLNRSITLWQEPSIAVDNNAATPTRSPEP
jgi:SpoIID/LytB domain protein